MRGYVLAAVLATTLLTAVPAQATTPGQVVGETTAPYLDPDLHGYDRVARALEKMSVQQGVDDEALLGGWGPASAWADVLVDPCAQGDAWIVRVRGGAVVDGGWVDEEFPDRPGFLEHDPDGLFGAPVPGDAGTLVDVKASEDPGPDDGGDPQDDDGPLDNLEGPELWRLVDEGSAILWRHGEEGWVLADSVTERKVATPTNDEDDAPQGVREEDADPEGHVDPCEADSPKEDGSTDEVSAKATAESYKDTWVGNVCGWKTWLGREDGVDVDVGVSSSTLDDVPVGEKAEQTAPCLVLESASIPDDLDVGWDLTHDGGAAARITTGTRLGHAIVPAAHTMPSGAGVPDLLALPSTIVTASSVPAGWSGLAPLAGAVGLAATAIGVALIVLYRRLTEDDVLGNDLRVRLLELVRDHPGANASALARHLDVAVTTVLYHGRVLAETGHLTKKRSGGEVMFFLADQAETVLEREVLVALQRDGKRDLLRLLADQPGLNISQAARRLDRNRSTVKRHVDDLEAKGIVRAKADGRSRTLTLARDVRELVAA